MRKKGFDTTVIVDVTGLSIKEYQLFTGITRCIKRTTQSCIIAMSQNIIPSVKAWGIN